MSSTLQNLKLDQSLKDDFRQSYVICKNEMRKFLRGKKFAIFGIIMLILIAIETIVPYALGDGYDTNESFTIALVGTVATIIELAGVLFTSTSLVSEFQDRTALILFTKPVRKRSIFIGKILASILIVSAFTIVYYIFVAIVTYALEGAVVANLWISFLFALVGIFAISGFSMMISSIAKNAGTAIIITLLMLLFLLGLVSGLLDQFAGISSIWCLVNSFDCIMNSLDITMVIAGRPIGYTASATTLATNVVVLIIWGVVSSIIGYILFKRRDF